MSLQRKNRQRGKRAQRNIAALLGEDAMNVGTLGKCDILAYDFAVEVKDRASFVAEKWMKQAENNAILGLTPMVVVHIRGTKFTESLVLIRMRDFLEMYKNGLL